MRSRRLAVPLLAALAVAACETPTANPVDVDAPPVLQMDAVEGAVSGVQLLERLNAVLAEGEHGVQIASMEYLTVASSGRVGQTIFANNRGNRRLAGQFVPSDVRRGGGEGIAFLIDAEGATASGLTPSQTGDAIRSAMATWESQTCSTLPLVDLGDFAGDLGLVEFSISQALGLGLGGSPLVFADVTHAGWLPAPFFDAVDVNGSEFILGVTFTLVFENPPLDTDGDGYFDVAAREIYYNDAFEWNVDGSNIDVESVALHESGHGLSQGHFGKIFRTDANGTFHFAPLAVMNAAHSGVLRQLTGTDNGGHCGIWGSWPNN